MRKSVPKSPEKSPKEKLNEVAGSKPLTTAPPKKMTGKKKPDDLTPQRRGQLEQPLKKGASSAAKEEQAPRESTDADLEKLKAFFGKNEAMRRWIQVSYASALLHFHGRWPPLQR